MEENHVGTLGSPCAGTGEPLLSLPMHTSFIQTARRLADRGEIADPKRRGSAGPTEEQIFGYYAGFSPDFARSVLESDLTAGASLVLDPWNGSGTTTSVAHSLELDAVGVDLNPVAAQMASARLANKADAEHVYGLLGDVVAESPVEPNDPLLQWLHPDTAATARACVNKVLSALAVDAAGRTVDPTSAALPPLAAFAILAVMKACKRAAGSEDLSNPTWIRPASPDTRDRQRFMEEVHRAALEMAWILPDRVRSEIRLRVGDARRLEIEDGTVDVVLSSPPYCTRLDYVVNTSVELATLGITFRGERFTKMRRAMAGTPLARPAVSPRDPDARWGAAVCELLTAIRSHGSRDSSGYYYKGYYQYFADMYRSLLELGRVLRPGGGALLVVQDSYYKELHVDLPRLLVDMARAAGLRSELVAVFPVSRVMTTMNSRARKRHSKHEYSETVLAVER